MPEDFPSPSEARYHALFNAIDEGFCVIEFLDGPHGKLSDYVHIEANPAYARHTGIPNVVGQRLRDMVPAEANDWLARYRPVLEDGQPRWVGRRAQRARAGQRVHACPG